MDVTNTKVVAKLLVIRIAKKQHGKTSQYHSMYDYSIITA